MKVICDNVSEECSKGCDHLEPHEKIDSCILSHGACFIGNSSCIPVEENEVKSSEIKDYHVVFVDDLGILMKEIKERIEKGWEPLGGAFFYKTNNFSRWYQTIIKRGLK